jgi:outer membrane protein assembly factor BamA
VRRPALLLVLAACHSAPRRPEIAAPCDAGRIGRVAVTGAPRGVVPGLAVLEGTHDEPARTERIVQAATEALRWRGYPRARLAVTRATGCFVELRVAVALGPRFRIARIDFDTDDDFPAAERLAAIEDALGTVNTVGGVHIDYRLRRALDGLERRYRDAGWLDARIGTPDASYSDGGRVELAIKIAAGKRYRIGVIRALGANAQTREAVLDELGVEAGAWYDGPALRRGIERARRKVARPVELRTRDTRDGVIEVEAVLGATR